MVVIAESVIHDRYSLDGVLEIAIVDDMILTTREKKELNLECYHGLVQNAAIINNKNELQWWIKVVPPRKMPPYTSDIRQIDVEGSSIGIYDFTENCYLISDDLTSATYLGRGMLSQYVNLEQ